MHCLQIKKDLVAKATAAYTTGTLKPADEVTLTEKDGTTERTVTLTDKKDITKDFKTYHPKNELNKIVAKEYLGDDTKGLFEDEVKGDVDTELRIIAATVTTEFRIA